MKIKVQLKHLLYELQAASLCGRNSEFKSLQFNGGASSRI